MILTIFNWAKNCMKIHVKIFYDISYKTFMGAKPLCINFNKVDGFIKIYNGTRKLLLFGPERYNAT